jgi:RimJ/RimL family protein N-acetyltransferase
VSQAQARVERAMGYFAARVGFRWTMARAADDRFIGHISVFNFHDESARAELGYGLDRRHWGQGLMREALTTVIDYAFGPLGLRRLEADTHPSNAASMRALERLGFVQEGLMRERWQVADEISDTAFWGLLAKDWAVRPRAGG